MIKYQVSFLFILLSINTWGKNYTVLNYTTGKGLPSNIVYDICQDKDGFLWFATDKGISRFHGNKFENFNTDDGLPDNEVFILTPDHHGRLWIGTYSGKIGFFKNGKFYSENNTPYLKLPFERAMIRQLTLAKDSSIIVDFMDHPAIVNINNTKVSIYPFKSGKAITKDYEYIEKLSKSSYKLFYRNREVIIDTNFSILSLKHYANKVVFSKKEKPYLFTTDSFYTTEWTPVNSAPKGFNHEQIVNCIYADKSNYFWGMLTGLIANGTDTVLHGISVSQIVRDHEGNYWISTIGKGVYILDGFFNTSRYYPGAYEGKVKYAKAIDSNLFIGTNNKTLYRLTNGKGNCLFNGSEHAIRLSSTVRNGYSIYKDAYFAFGNDENFVVKNINTTGKPVKKVSNRLPIYINELLFKEPYIYLFSHMDIFSVSYADITSAAWNEQVSLVTDSSERKYIYGKAMDADSGIWYSTANTVYKLINGKAVQQTQFGSIGFKNMNIIRNHMVGYTHGNKLLVCTDFKDEKIKIDTINSDKAVWDKLYKLDETHLLVSTNNKYRILTFHSSGSKKKFTISTLENPFIPTDVEYICADGTTCYFLKDGNITTVSINGLLQLPGSPQKPIFFSVKVGDRSVNTDTAIVLKHAQAKYISIRIGAPALNRDILYEYTVNKHNVADEWRSTGTDIELYNLDYGDYTIKIRAKTISSYYSQPASLHLTVLKPLWVRSWFIGLCVIVSATVVFLISSYKTRRVLMKKNKAHQVEIRFLKSEYKLLNALMNPHFIFNSLNSVQWLVNKDDKQSANDYLIIFSELIRQNMQNASSELISLQKEINLIVNYLKLEKLRFKEHFNYKLEVEEDIDLEEIMIPPLLIQPLVENSIKHGLFPKQSITNAILIRIYNQQDGLHIDIIDNGIGLRSATNHNHSSAIDNIRKRIEHLSKIHEREIVFEIGETFDSDGSTSGTKATLIIYLSVTSV